MKQEQTKACQRLDEMGRSGQNGLDGVRWLDTATRGIRFKPDRAAVRRELEAHLEDKRADLQRIFPDLSRQEAEAWALASMGDPEALGRELAKIHRPWLGYLWRISQWAAGIAICFALVFLLVTSMDFWPAQHQDSWLGSMGMEGFLEKLYPEGQDMTCRSLAPGEGRRIGDHMVQVAQAELWGVQTEQGPKKAVYLILESGNLRPWESVSGEVSNRL